jgi:hypothetical protein
VAQSIVPVPAFVWGGATRYLLTTTAATPVAAVPVGGRNLAALVTVYVSVPSGQQTTLTVTVAWTDPDTGADSYAVINGATLTGNTQGLPVPLLAAAGSLITVTATAGTANVARVTVTVLGGELT